jgi:hypothetical protein
MTMMTMRRIDRRCAALGLWAVALFVLAGCGAGGGSVASAGGGGISGTGMSVGSVTGFGSVFVNGTEFDTTSATIVVEGSGATQSDLRVGNVVVVNANFDDDKASRVEYRAQIKGPVQALTVQNAALGAATLTVFGQAVVTNSATNLAGTQLDQTLPDALAVGDVVEVSGLFDANGTLVATYFETKPALSQYQVIGKVADLTATTFRIGALTIDFSSGSASPRAGDTVEASGPASGFDAATNTFVADSVETLTGLSPAHDEALEVEGYITRFASPSDFDVGTVKAQVVSTTRFEGGSAASLAQNVKVEIEGRVDSNGVLVADKVEIKSTASVRLDGNVEQIDAGAQRLVVLGVGFTLRAEAELDDNSSAERNPLTFADLAVGDRVRVRGFLDGTAVIASQLERDDPSPGARLRGRVTATNPAASQIAILGVSVTGNGATQYGGASDQTAFFNNVRIGDSVEADWDAFTATTAPADVLSIQDD